MLAYIDESACIGCTFCLQACPVDCIVGAAKQMHTVIAQDCIGCQLCVPVCPMACIHLEESPPLNVEQKARARTQVKRRKDRLNAENETVATAPKVSTIQQSLEAALERARQKRLDKGWES